MPYENSVLPDTLQFCTIQSVTVWRYRIGTGCESVSLFFDLCLSKRHFQIKGFFSPYTTGTHIEGVLRFFCTTEMPTLDNVSRDFRGVGYERL